MSTQPIVKTATVAPALWNEIDDVQAENLNGGVIKIKNFYAKKGSIQIFVDSFSLSLGGFPI
jgi:outer membrane protein assembly factor BamA